MGTNWRTRLTNPATAAARRRLTGLEFLDESGQKNLLGKKGAYPRGDLANDGPGLAPQPLDGLNRPVHFAMSHCGARMLRIELVQHFRQVARAGADVKDRSSDDQNIVDLAGMVNQLTKLDEETDGLSFQGAQLAVRGSGQGFFR
jgi:hypothetical protein